MAGAGDLPGRAAAEARRDGWRVTAFAFGEAPGLAESAERVVPSDVADIQPVVAELARTGARAAVFVGKFWKQEAFARHARGDAAAQRLARGGLSDEALGGAVAALFDSMGIEILDARRFLAPWLATRPALTVRVPSAEEWEDIRAGLRLARLLAQERVGQTVVRARGATVAVEALEGTDQTIRRGLALAGPGCVVVKAVAADHDYRFDVPAVGTATLGILAEGRASVLALERDRVLLLDPDAAAELADRAGIALVSVDDER
jgi:hypothetical protein